VVGVRPCVGVPVRRRREIGLPCGIGGVGKPGVRLRQLAGGDEQDLGARRMQDFAPEHDHHACERHLCIRGPCGRERLLPERDHRVGAQAQVVGLLDQDIALRPEQCHGGGHAEALPEFPHRHNGGGGGRRPGGGGFGRDRSQRVANGDRLGRIDSVIAKGVARRHEDPLGLRHGEAFGNRRLVCLARLWRRQGKHKEARELLAPVYDWFTEGFDTSYLKEAKTLLDELT